MTNINFPAGNGTTSFNPFFQSGYVQQTGVTRPAANPALDGTYPIYIDQINISGASGDYSLRLRSGSTNYTVGSIFNGSASSSTISIRMYHNSGTVYFSRVDDGLDPKVKQYTDADALYYTWNGGMRGNWDYFLVPVAPTITATTLSGRSVTISYTANSNGGSTVTSTTIQRRIGTGSWVTHSSSDLLDPATTYEFRVYQTNIAGDGAASTSSIYVPGFGYRYTSTTSKTPISTVKVFVGVGVSGADSAGWKTVQNIKKYTSSGWTDLTA